MDERTAHLLVKVAELYYLQDQKQDDIARALRVSRPHVSRLLKRARQEGIVTISVRPPFTFSSGLAGEIRKAFPLQDVLVVPSSAAPLARVAETAGRYLAGQIRQASVVGVSWGRTVRMIVDSFPNVTRRSMEAVPLVGGMGQVGDEIHANEIARRLALRLGGKYYVLNAPAMAESSAARATLVRGGGVRAVLEKARKVDVAVVGIGSLVPTSTLVQSGYLQPEHLRGLRAAGAVGDICSRFFCRDGGPCRSSITDRVVGIELDDLCQLPCVVGAAAGVDKATAILGALRGGFIKVLVTDEAAARAVIRLAQAKP